MKPDDFIATYFGEAKQVENESGIDMIAILAQAALESGWGVAAPRYNFFGVKALPPFTPENSQLLITHEWAKVPNYPFPHILSVMAKNGGYDYTIQDYFRAYASAHDGFSDHTKFFMQNSRYHFALQVKDDYRKFLPAVAAAGYATDPNYATTILAVANTVNKVMFA